MPHASVTARTVANMVVFMDVSNAGAFREAKLGASHSGITSQTLKKMLGWNYGIGASKTTQQLQATGKNADVRFRPEADMALP
jgi:hypothetical protein